METPFTLENANGFAIVTFTTSSLMNAAELERLTVALDMLADKQGNGKLVMDFTKVEYLSSQAIGMVVGLHKKAAKVPGGKLILCGVGAQLMQLLKITRLDRLLKVVNTKQEAIK